MARLKVQLTRDSRLTWARACLVQRYNSVYYSKTKYLSSCESEQNKLTQHINPSLSVQHFFYSFLD